LIQELSFVIYGAPRTKKNHGRRKYSFRMKRTLNIPSEAYENWASIALKSLPLIRQQIADAGVKLPIAADVNCAALFYRQADAGDACGFYQGLADWMEDVGILVDDVQVRQWDGARLRKDSKLPRIEVTLDELPAREKAPRSTRKKGDADGRRTRRVGANRAR